MNDKLPPDLARFLGLPVGPRALPGPAPITQQMIDALKEARKTKGEKHMTDDEREWLVSVLENPHVWSIERMRNVAAQLRADGERIKALEAERQWRPIETAPRDGTPILVYFRGVGVRQVFWADPFSENMEFALWCVDDNKHGPYFFRGYMAGDDTHWMPLPAPPKETNND